MTLSPWTTWLTQAIEQLYQPLTTDEDSEFNSRFSRIISPNAVINVNHESVSVSAFEKSLKDEVVASNLVSGVKVDWKETFEVPDANGEGLGGIVAGFFIVTRTMKFRIRAAPAERLGYRFFSAKVVKDESVQADVEGNHWRVSEFFLTETNKPAPIQL